MKILFINPVGTIGGAERLLLTLFNALKTIDPNIQLYLIAGTDGPLLNKAQALGVEVRVLQLPQQLNQLGDSKLNTANSIITVLSLSTRLIATLPSVWRYLVKLRRLIRKIHPDIVHSNGIKSHLLTAIVRLNKVPLVWHIHDFYSTRSLVKWILKGLSNHATIGIAVSKAVAIDAQKTLLGLPIQLIYNAVDTTYFSPKVIPLYPSHNERDDAIVRVGLIATFAHWKGHGIFLEAAAQVIHYQKSNGKSPNVRFYIIGGTIYQTKDSQVSEQGLRDLAFALQIADYVEFSGYQSTILDSYYLLDIVVHASTQPEPFGLVVVEAMACGKAVIVTQTGGAAELFTHNDDAVGVPPHDCTALAQAMQQLIDNTNRRTQLAKNARKTALENFSQERLGKQVLEVYQNL